MITTTSRSLRARGLKQLELDKKNKCLKSRSLRARGLKPVLFCLRFPGGWSRSLRARGLKRFSLHPLECYFHVALFTGAWIETIYIIHNN